MGVKRSYERRNVLGRVFVLRDALRAVPRPSRSLCFAAIVIIAVLASLLLLWLYPGLATPFAVPVHFGQSNAYGRRQARRRQLVVKARAPKDSPRVERHPNWWLPKRDGTSAQIVNWRQWEALNQFDRHVSNATGTGAAERALAHSMVDRHLFGATGRRVAFEHTQSRISSGMQPHFYAPPGFVGGEEKGSAGWPSRPGLSGGQGALFVDHPTSDYPPPARPRRVVRAERARQRLLRQEWVADRAAVARVVVLKLPRSGSTWFTELLNAYPSVFVSKEILQADADLPRSSEKERRRHLKRALLWPTGKLSTGAWGGRFATDYWRAGKQWISLRGRSQPGVAANALSRLDEGRWGRGAGLDGAFSFRLDGGSDGFRGEEGVTSAREKSKEARVVQPARASNMDVLGFTVNPIKVPLDYVRLARQRPTAHVVAFIRSNTVKAVVSAVRGGMTYAKCGANNLRGAEASRCRIAPTLRIEPAAFKRMLYDRLVLERKFIDLCYSLGRPVYEVGNQDPNSSRPLSPQSDACLPACLPVVWTHSPTQHQLREVSL